MQIQKYKGLSSFIKKGLLIPFLVFGIFFGNTFWSSPINAATPQNEIGPTGEDPLIREFFQTVFGESAPDFSNPNLKIVPNILPNEGVQSGNIKDGSVAGVDIASRTLSEDKIIGCANANELFLWDGTNWECVTKETIGLQQVSTSSDGYFTGLGTSASPLSINPSKIQKRISGSCDLGTFLQGIGEDGSPTCASPIDGDKDPTNEIQGTISGGGIVRDGDNRFGLLSSCASGEVLQWRDDGSGQNTWQCTPKNFVNFWQQNTTNISYIQGNVGIGTSTPQSKLDVNGEIIARNGFGEGMYIGGDNANHDLEIGSLDPTVTGITFWSRSPSGPMNISAKNIRGVDGSFSGNLSATNLSGINTGDQGIMANQGLRVDGKNFGLLNTCANSEVLKWNGTNSTWECKPDLGIITELDPLVKPFAKNNLPSCPNGQVLVGDGTTLSCVPDKQRSETEVKEFITNSNLDMGSFTVIVPEPTASGNAANKGYVDNLIAGLSWKEPVNAGANPTGTDEFGIHGVCDETKKTWTAYNKDNDMIYTCNGYAWIALSTSVGTPNATDTVPGKIQITGDLSGSYDSPQIKADSIVNADINSTAEIAGTKISPDFGSQNIFTTGNIGIGTTSISTGLKLDTEGKIGATEYCDQNGQNCSTAIDLNTWKKNTINNSTKVYYDGSGYVGIGTNNPSQMLEVNGVIKADAFIMSDGSVPSGIWSVSSTNSVFYNSGNVGIGTGTPTTKLQVVGTITATDFVKEDGTSLTSTWSKNGTNTYYNAGNVGIGTTTPATTFQVLGTDQKARILISSGDSTNPALILDNDSDLSNNNHWAIYGDNTSNSLRFWKSGSNRFEFSNDGKMGIGLASGDPIVASLHAVNTTGEQLRLQNNATNYASFTADDQNALNVQVAGGSDSQVIIGNETNQNNLLLFNGDVEKYHIALDATDDVLKIGKGETVGNSANTFLTINGTGMLGIKTSIPSSALDIGGDSMRLRLSKTPTSATETCEQGTIAWDADAIYICVAQDQWKKSALTTW
jgi:hypothetical protein